MNKTLFLLMISLLQVEDCSAKADELTVLRQLENNAYLPLTGNELTDGRFRRELAKILNKDHQPLPPRLAKKFDDLSYHLGLDHQELIDSAMGVAAAGRRMVNNLESSEDMLITPNNVKTMPLGAMLWTGQSMFNRRSIFDPGILNGLSLIPDLQGITEHGQTSKVSSRTEKETTSSKFTEDFGASVRYVGFGSSLGYKHDEAHETTTMGGVATASIYSYATNTVRIEAEQGDEYMELRGALRGKPFDKSALNNYVEITTVPVTPTDNSKTSIYTRIRVIKTFEGGLSDSPFEQSPNAHIQVLTLLENLFSDLKLQYERFEDHKEIQQITLLDMINLRGAINATIKNFQVEWGDSFVTEISGYSEVQGTGTLIQESKASNFERNNSGTITAGYSSFIGGGEASNSIGDWLKEANAYGASQIKTTVSERPNNGTNLTAYETSLNEWLNKAITATGTSAQLPPVAITPSMPTIPKVKDPQDNPFTPPKDAKDYAGWKKTVQDMAEGEGYKLPKWLQKKNEAEAKPNPVNGAEARDAVAKDMVADNLNRRSGRLIVDPDNANVSQNVVQAISDANQDADKSSISTVAMTGVRQEKLIGSNLYKRIGAELKALKAYGKKQSTKRNKSISETWAAASGASRLEGTLANDPPNEITLDKMLVSNFKVLPYTAVLSALRPNLELPASLDGGIEGFVNTSVLLATLNRYYTLDTYINFIKSIPESGLGNTNIPSSLHDYVGQLEKFIMPLVQTSMSSGDDVSDALLQATLNKQIVGLSSDGKTRDIKTTILYQKLGKSTENYNYIYNLAEKPDNYRVIGKAPGGYLPLSLGAKRTGDGKLCLPRLAQVKQLPGLKTKEGYQPTYVHASECIEITANTDIPKLMAGHPQSPMFPLFIFADRNHDPILNFVQFVGGYRLIVGRDVTMAPWVDDLTTIPTVPLTPISDENKWTLGYNPNMTGDPARLKEILWLTPGGDSWMDKRSLEGVYINAFRPEDMSWKYSPWFNKNDSGSIEGYDENEVLTVKFSDNTLEKQNVSGSAPFYARGNKCDKGTYCLITTSHFMAPYSFEIDPSDPNGFGMVPFLWQHEPMYSYLIGPVGTVGADGNYSLGKVTGRSVADHLGTWKTGGLMLLYPVTTEMLNKLGSGVFAYSSGSKPKDIYNMDDNGKSPFDKGFIQSFLK